MKRAVYFFTKSSIIFCIFLLTFFTSPNKVEAGPYFSKILEGIIPTFSFSIPKYINFGNNNAVKDPTNEKANTEDTKIDIQEIKAEEKMDKVKTSTPTPKTVTTNINSYLNSILEKLGIVKSPNPSDIVPTTIPVSSVQNAIPTNMTQPTQAQPQPQQQNPLAQLTNSLLGGVNRSTNPNNNTSNSSGQQALATPYNGPGGSIPGDCGIPKGPIAYNIGTNNGSGVRCNANTVFVGFKQTFRDGIFNAGYINPLLEKGMQHPQASIGNCKQTGVASQYSEKCFSDYSSGVGQAYIQEQILHFQNEGKRTGQKCVPIDIDNCDSIGGENYRSILDQVEKLNNNAEVKIKVFTKNPQTSGCNFLSHPAVVGAVIEGINPTNTSIVANSRSKPEQLLLFLRGNTGSNEKLKAIDNLKIPNSAFSYDNGKEYENIFDCTYNP